MGEALRRAGVPDPTKDEQFGSHLVEGATSMAMFMAGGLATRAIGLSGAVGSAGLGAFQMGGQGFREVEQKIAELTARVATFNDPKDKLALERLNEVKYLALFANMGLGATEAIPLERFFNRLNQAVPGNKVAHIMSTTAAQSLEEMAQEVGQHIGQATVAKLLYDEGREIRQDITQSAEVAAVLGGLMGFGAGASGPTASRRAAGQGLQEWAAEVLKQGNFVPPQPEKPRHESPAPSGEAPASTSEGAPEQPGVMPKSTQVAPPTPAAGEGQPPEKPAERQNRPFPEVLPKPSQMAPDGAPEKPTFRSKLTQVLDEQFGKDSVVPLPQKAENDRETGILRAYGYSAEQMATMSTPSSGRPRSRTRSRRG